MKLLTLDIETAPALGDVWSLWNVNVGLSQLRQVSTVICFAAKWHDSTKVEYFSDFHHGHEDMVAAAYDLLGDADAVQHYNGTRFDLPHLRREFLLAGMPPHKPVQEIDLMKVVKAKFRFMSNKLDHVAQQLGIGSKVSHAGHSLWVRCMAGTAELAKPEAQRNQVILADAAKAWAQMKRYNIGDVRLTEELGDRLKPWIHNYPHAGLHTGQESCCNRCASVDLERRGYAYTPLGKFQQYRCNECGGWSRGKTTLARVNERGVA